MSNLSTKGFEILVVVSTKTAAIWDAIPCSVVYTLTYVHNRLGRERYLCQQGQFKALLHCSQCSHIPTGQYEQEP
jgi:hypothetical protein